jgi:hypothetical protein
MSKKVKKTGFGVNNLWPLSDNDQAGLDSYDESFEVRFVYNSNSINRKLNPAT